MRCRDVLAEDLADMGYELVHVVVGLVDVVEHVVALCDIVDKVFHKSHDVADIGHRLLILALADHQELTG